MRSALSLSASAAYPLALPVNAALRDELEHAATHVRWSRATHWQCPKDVRTAARSLALTQNGDGLAALNPDVWGLLFSFLIDGEHARRPLRNERRAMLGACCAGGDAAAPCVACCAALYSDRDDGAGGRATSPSPPHRSRKKARRA